MNIYSTFILSRLENFSFFIWQVLGRHMIVLSVRWSWNQFPQDSTLSWPLLPYWEFYWGFPFFWSTSCIEKEGTVNFCRTEQRFTRVVQHPPLVQVVKMKIQLVRVVKEALHLVRFTTCTSRTTRMSRTIHMSCHGISKRHLIGG